MANPLGMLTPWGVKAWYISPRDAFFPPTNGIFSARISPNQRIYIACEVLTVMDRKFLVAISSR
jgi:hypothetical protein